MITSISFDLVINEPVTDVYTVVQVDTKNEDKIGLQYDRMRVLLYCSMLCNVKTKLCYVKIHTTFTESGCIKYIKFLKYFKWGRRLSWRCLF